MSALPEPVPASPQPDEQLLALVDAALKCFGRGIRLVYRTGSATCVITFPREVMAAEVHNESTTAAPGATHPAETRRGSHSIQTPESQT